jgi:Cysteine rich repeat
MKRLTLLLLVCGTAAAQSALADVQPSLDAVRAACADDAQKLCAGVQPGGGRIVVCLKEHKDSLSDRCKQAAGLPVGQSSSPAPVAAAAAVSVPAAAQTKPAPASKANPAKANPAKANPAKVSAAAGGEKFAERVITDPDHGGMRAATIHVPEKWRFEGKVEWHYGWVEYPVSSSSHAENPDNAEAYFQYPRLRFDYTEVPPQLRQYVKGHQYGPGERLPTGALSSPPQPAMHALAAFIQKTRSGVSNLKWLGQQDLPDLANALRLEASPNQHGVAIKIGYDLSGQAVEEAFFGVYYLSKGANAGVGAGTIKQTNWGLQALQSFRAPAGSLEKRMPIFCVIAKSFYLNPEWARLSKAITDKMLADFNQKLKEGYDQLRAAQAIVDQTMKQQAAFQANFDKQEAAFRNSGGVDDSYLRDGGKRSAADHWDDVIRGVDTLNDPNGGTTQLSNLGQYHFTDGFGNYRTTDDPNYTPEQAGEVGSWSRMTTAP